MGIPVVVSVALATADDDGIADTQSVPAAGALALNGAFAEGDSVNNIAAAQTLGGAGNVTLNGSTVTGGVSYIYGKSVQIISAGDDSGITFTVYGIGPDGLSSQVETVTGSNTSVVATRLTFHSISQIAASGATDGNITVGTNGIAIIAEENTARQVLLTTSADDTALRFTIYGTNAQGNPISEVLTGVNNTTAATVNHYQTITQILASAASTGTITFGTNGVGSTRFVSMSYHAQPVNISTAVVVSGTINYTLQYTYDDVNSISNPTWFSTTEGTSQAANKVLVQNDPIFGSRVLVNSSTAPASLTATYIEAGLIG